MIRITLLFSVVVFAAAAQPREVDICVYGGTSAGVIAAYTAKMNGKSVLLIEPGLHPGGLSSGGLGYTDIGNKFAVTGLARNFYRRIGQNYGKLEQWIFEPHVAENVFKDYLQRSEVEVWYDHRLVSVSKNQNTISEIVVEQSSHPSPSTNRIVKAKMFIDCSYEGDLMARAGVSYTIGREGNNQYGETYNGVQLRDKHQFADGIDPYKIPGDRNSGLLWGISTETVAKQGTGDKKVQAYNFRICLTNQQANMIPITQPPGYDSTRYELLVRLMQKEPNRPFNLILKPDLMPNGKTDINNNGPFSTDMIGMNYDYPEADYDRRKQIIRAHEEYSKGLLYFIGHSKRLPDHLRVEMLKWGYPKDEYIDNGYWSPQMYVREARRLVGEYVMTQANCEGRTKVDDGVGMAAYTMDSHNIQRVVVNGMVKNEGDVQIGGFPPYPISYRSLIPKATECRNLIVPVCLSASHIAYGSIRMEPVFMVLAQSAAVAASMAIDKKIGVQQVNVKLLQQKIKADPLADKSVPEVLVDNDDAGVVKEGNWALFSKATGSYGPTLLADTLTNVMSRSVKFTPAIAKPGAYNLYVYCPKMQGGATKVNLIVFDGKQKRDVTISPNDVQVEGQTSGEWIAIGKYNLPLGKSAYVAITNKGADGIVVADAVLAVPAF